MDDADSRLLSAPPREGPAMDGPKPPMKESERILQSLLGSPGRNLWAPARPVPVYADPQGPTPPSLGQGALPLYGMPSMVIPVR